MIDFFAGYLFAALVCWAWAQRLLRKLRTPPPDVLVEVFARCPCARLMIVKAPATQLVRLSRDGVSIHIPVCKIDRFGDVYVPLVVPTTVAIPVPESASAG